MKKAKIIIQVAPEYAPNNWRDCQSTLGGLEGAKKLLPRLKSNNPNGRYRIIERKTINVDSVIYSPD